jgi:hypothetical protein
MVNVRIRSVYYVVLKIVPRYDMESWRHAFGVILNTVHEYPKEDLQKLIVNRLIEELKNKGGGL